jgi:copper oxidase (laccase) domain-containing protein
MESLGAIRHRITAAIGPCISGANYEVGPEFKARFDAADPANARHFAPSPRAHHWLFDLEAYVAARLSAAGIAATRLSACTYARKGDFFSFRRATHRGESGYGRQVSAILLTDK